MKLKLSKVDCSRGAPMGRRSDTIRFLTTEGSESTKVYARRMRMSPCGAYDEGGACWGCATRESGYMYCVYDSEGNQAFTRAFSSSSAKQEVFREQNNKVA